MNSCKCKLRQTREKKINGERYREDKRGKEREIERERIEKLVYKIINVFLSCARGHGDKLVGAVGCVLRIDDLRQQEP